MCKLNIFINYFNAIKVVFENDWEKGSVFKTTVLGGLIKSLGDVFDETFTFYKNFKNVSGAFGCTDPAYPEIPKSI